MGTSVRPVPSIDQDLAAIRAKGAGAAPSRSIDADLAAIRGAIQTPAATTPAPTGNFGDAVNSSLDVLGLGKQLRGAGAFVKDLVQSHDLSHATNAYSQQLASDKARLSSYEAAHPTAASVGQGVGVLATLLGGEAVPLLKAATSLPQAVPATVDAAKGVMPALSRIGQAMKTGGVVGTAVAGANADGSLARRIGDALIGGGAGALLAGAGRATGEATGGARGILRGLMTPAADAGEQAAVGRMRAKLSADQMMPDDLLTQAMQAKQTGTPAVAAHLAGPSMDNLTWLATTGPSAEASALRSSVRNAQRAEGGILSRGITAMSGVDASPANDARVLGEGLTTARANEAAVNYPKAYASPPLTDDKILQTIREDPELTAALTEGVNIMKREQQVAALRGQPTTDVKNPLDMKPGNTITLTDQGRQLHEQFGTDLDVLLKRGLASQTTTDTPSLPIQMLDYMKRGADVVVEKGLKRGNLSAHDAGLLQQKVDAILEKVDQASPTYAAARADYAQRSGEIEAAAKGEKALQQSGPAITSEIAALPSAGAADAYTTSATSALRDQLGRKNTDRNLTRGFDNPFTEGQLQALYPSGRSQFQPYLDQGQRVNAVRDAVAGNSKTAERQSVQNEALGRSAVDAAGAMTNPRRFFLNLPGKIADARDTKVKAVMLQSLARQLNIPAASPELPALVERLYNVTQRPVEDAAGNALRQRILSRGAGVLAGLFGANQ